MARTQPRVRASKLARLVNSEESMVRFRELYCVPPSIRLAYCHTDNIPVINKDEILLPIMAVVEGGVRFPLHPLLINFLQTVNASPSQVSVNLFRIIMGEESRTSCHLKAKNVNKKLVNGLPDTNKGYDKDYLRVLGDWFTDGSACRSLFGYPDPSRIEVHEKQADVELVKRVLATNVYVDQRGEPRSAPLLLRYEPQIRSFLEGPTIPRSQEVRATGGSSSEATKGKGKSKNKGAGAEKKPKKIVTETPTPEQNIQATVNQEPPQPLPVIHNIDESDHGEELAPRKKRGRTEEPSIPAEGSSSNLVAWEPELLFGPGPISIRDTVLDESETELSAQVAHGLTRAACLLEDMKLWDSMSSGRVFRHVTRAHNDGYSRRPLYGSQEDQHFKNVNVMKEAKERARTEAANRERMEGELAKMKDKVKKLESKCILSIGKAQEEGKAEGKVLGKEAAMDEARTHQKHPNSSCGANTLLPYPTEGLKDSDDEDEEEGDEGEEAAEEEGEPDKSQEESRPAPSEMATDVPGLGPNL
uniref:Uncharacterized protein n=1 Tax=Fagus sylvatica TaxID=28930 RepID=A0A2N9FWJ5_FAGSY